MLQTIRAYLIKIESVIAAASLLLLLVLSMVQLLARNFFDTGFPDLDVVMRHLILFVSFMGAVLATERSTHIKIDVATAFLSSEFCTKLIRPLFLLSAFVCMVFCWYSIQYWLGEWEFAPVNEKWSVPFALMIPVGFGLLAIHFLLLSVLGVDSRYKEHSK
ncbi:MAG: TRAP transporter small permease subunit [Gammaproteobacteria bacterium]|nr:TRAP transporter small permease subunit [Gammaproteobacteria bacterium]